MGNLANSKRKNINMKKNSLVKMVASLAIGLSLSAGVCQAQNYSSTVNSLIQFNGDGTLTFTPNTNNLRITSGSAAGFLGEITGTFTIGTITTVAGNSTAPMTGTGKFVIHDGTTDFSATLVWVDVGQKTA